MTTLTTSTGYVSSRPDTPSLAEPDYAELGHPSVNIRGVSMDSHDRLETRNAVHKLADGYAGNYSVDALPMTPVEKDHV